MTIDCASVPKHLKVMRAITGIEEEPGSGDNPKIMGMRDWIACTYPEMMDYCEGYTGDDVAWCGLAAAYCCTVAGIRPPYDPGDDLKSFLWAQSFGDDVSFEHLDEPVLGTIVVMKREGGGHVTFFEGWNSDGTFKARGGNQSDEVNVQNYDRSAVIAWVWPRDVPKPGPGPSPSPDGERRELEEGDTGSDVEELQQILSIPTDGEFGPTTDGAVKGFQCGYGLDVDGVVGPQTWEELDALDARRKAGYTGLTKKEAEAVEGAARKSHVATYVWPGRGLAPMGYMVGLALSYGVAVKLLQAKDSIIEDMAQADRGDGETDVLSWYHKELENLDWNTDQDGVETLRALFSIMLGLGMRESTGRYCEGRDLSAENVEDDTAEAGLFQTSWNIASCADTVPPLLDMFDENPNGFVEAFREDVNPSGSELENYGTGTDGGKYQFLSKYAPMFHVFVTGIGLRYRRQHWGPVNRREVTLLDAAYDLFIDVEAALYESRPHGRS
jgi:uncharacterized protein (TIGR02594 family)